MKRREPMYIAAIIVLLAIAIWRQPSRTAAIAETLRDTVVVCDTIRDTVLIARSSRMVRTDTVLLRAADDTVYMEVEVPIERKTYRTEDYRAIVEGFRPVLAEMEIFRNTVYITDTQIRSVARKRRWGIGVQAGYGYGAGGLSPYIGVGVQYNIVSW